MPFRLTGAPANLFELAHADLREEQFAALVEAANVKIERIVSNGQASPPGFWYDQVWAEWVVLLSGSAGLRFEGEADVLVLRAGDHVLIPARKKHRVEWTEASGATIWLAVHYAENE
jgi:cupin 2 domain-containing protein